MAAMRTLHDKLALVTGAASGIGRAIALELAAAGTRLLLVDIDGAGLAQTASQAIARGVAAQWHIADLSDAADVHRIARLALEAEGGLDILVNNAGVAYYGLTHQMTEEQWQRLLGVNLLAPLQLTRELLPHLLERPESHVLNVCSIAGLVGVSRLAAYNATKFALVGFSESLRSEYGGRDLGVTALCPGLVRTRIFDSAMTSPNRQAPRFPNWISSSPEQVARRAVRAIRRNQGLVIVGGPARLIALIKRMSPTFLERLQRVRRVHRTAAVSPPPQAASVSMPRRAA
jgi:short-subunit dehydrogenase